MIGTQENPLLIPAPSAHVFIDKSNDPREINPSDLFRKENIPVGQSLIVSEVRSGTRESRWDIIYVNQGSSIECIFLQPQRGKH